MPYDGIVTNSIVVELKTLLTGSRIEKVHQVDRDTVVMGIRAINTSYRLLASASSTLPRVHLATVQPENPSKPPMFCMLLRKHIAGSRISDVTSDGFDRIITIFIESRDEFGDTVQKRLVTEIMGRHSNIMLLDSKGVIIDSIRHVDSEMSRIREVLPGKPYVSPPAQDKADPGSFICGSHESDLETFIKTRAAGYPEKALERFILDSFIGFSPLICREICFRSKLDSSARTSSLDSEQLSALSAVLAGLFMTIGSGRYNPCIIFDNGIPSDFHCIDIKCFDNRKHYQTTNEAVDEYYGEKARLQKIGQEKAALARSITHNLERHNKKRGIQEDVMRESADKDRFKLCGELLTAAAFSIAANSTSAVLTDYSKPEWDKVEIELDPELSALENAQRYFKKYRKASGTYTSTLKQLNETIREIDYLESALHMLDSAVSMPEIEEIRDELASQGVLDKKQQARRQQARARQQDARHRLAGQQKKKQGQGKQSGPVKTSQSGKLPPHSYISTDGFKIIAGRNNMQNDMITLKQASKNDLWLHTQKIPGSHVIIKTEGKADIPVRTIEEAALIAAWHSAAKNSSGVPVDYTQVRHIKKPPGSKPGYVIYTDFKTAIITPDASRISSLKQSQD